MTHICLTRPRWVYVIRRSNVYIYAWHVIPHEILKSSFKYHNGFSVQYMSLLLRVFISAPRIKCRNFFLKPNKVLCSRFSVPTPSISSGTGNTYAHHPPPVFLKIGFSRPQARCWVDRHRISTRSLYYKFMLIVFPISWFHEFISCVLPLAIFTRRSGQFRWHIGDVVLELADRHYYFQCSFLYTDSLRIARRHMICYIDGLVQDCSISIALAMEILQSCTKPSIWWCHCVRIIVITVYATSELRLFSFCCRFRSDPIVAVPLGVTVRQRQRGLHHVGGHERRVQVGGPWRGRSTMGGAEKQAQHELRQTKSRTALLLRQEYHDQSTRQTLCLQVRLCGLSSGHATLSLWPRRLQVPTGPIYVLPSLQPETELDEHACANP